MLSLHNLDRMLDLMDSWDKACYPILSKDGRHEIAFYSISELTTTYDN